MAPPRKRATRIQALLYALFFCVVSVLSFRTGVQSWHLGHPIRMARHTYGVGDSFVVGAGCLVLAGMLVAIALGWMKGGPEAPQ